MTTDPEFTIGGVPAAHMTDTAALAAEIEASWSEAGPATAVELAQRIASAGWVHRSHLDGAGPMPPEHVMSSTAAEHAARWNALPPAEREVRWEAWRDVHEAGVRCLEMGHDLRLHHLGGRRMVVTVDALRRILDRYQGEPFARCAVRHDLARLVGDADAGVPVDPERLPAEVAARVIFTALGVASSCWENMAGTGVFDDARAAAAGQVALEALGWDVSTLPGYNRPVDPEVLADVRRAVLGRPGGAM